MNVKFGATRFDSKREGPSTSATTFFDQFEILHFKPVGRARERRQSAHYDRQVISSNAHPVEFPNLNHVGRSRGSSSDPLKFLI